MILPRKGAAAQRRKPAKTDAQAMGSTIKTVNCSFSHWYHWYNAVHKRNTNRQAKTEQLRAYRLPSWKTVPMSWVPIWSK